MTLAGAAFACGLAWFACVSLDDIDAAVTAWTKGQDDYEAMHRLQQAGVPAGPLRGLFDGGSPDGLPARGAASRAAAWNRSRLFHDPHLRQGGYFTCLQTHDGIWRDLPGIGWRFDGGPAPYLGPAPVLGQDNDTIYRDLLGLSEAEIARLVEEQVIY